MSVIAQTAPLSDSVSQTQSGEYENHLNALGATPPVTWTTTVSSPYLLVTPTGIIGAASSGIPVGNYIISGTMVDGASNTGVWQFTLTVTSAVAQQAVVQPIVPSAPTGIEIMVPFQIDPATGGVAVLNNYVQILAQHILTIIMTAQGERIMLPSYGVGLENMLFQPIYTNTPGLLQSDLTNAIQSFEPAVTVQSVTVVEDPNNPYVLVVTVTYSVVPFNDVSTVSVTVGGGIGQIIS